MAHSALNDFGRLKAKSVPALCASPAFFSSGSPVRAAECDTDIVYNIGDAIKAIVLGVDFTTFELRASTAKFSEIHDRKRVAQYMKAPPPLTLGQLLSPEKEG